MKNWLAIIAVVLLFGCTSFFGTPTNIASPQPANVLQYSVKVVMRGSGFEDTGSGTSIYNDSHGYSYIITCDHVVADNGKITIFYKGKEYKAYIVRSLPDNDLAILSVKANIPAAPLYKGIPAIGNQEIIAGFPLGEGLLLTQGFFGDELPSNGFKTINADNGIDSPPLVGFGSASAWPGNSGGGVFALENNQWVLVGVTSDIDVTLSHPLVGAGVPYLELAPTLSHYIPLRYALPLLAAVQASLHGQSS